MNGSDVIILIENTGNVDMISVVDYIKLFLQAFSKTSFDNFSSACRVFPAEETEQLKAFSLFPVHTRGTQR